MRGPISFPKGDGNIVFFFPLGKGLGSVFCIIIFAVNHILQFCRENTRSVRRLAVYKRLRHGSEPSSHPASQNSSYRRCYCSTAAAAVDGGRKQKTSGDASQRTCNEARPRCTCFHSIRVLPSARQANRPTGGARRVELIRQQSNSAARRGTSLYFFSPAALVTANSSYHHQFVNWRNVAEPEG